LDTNKAVAVGAVRKPPLRLISIGFSPQLRNSYCFRVILSSLYNAPYYNTISHIVVCDTRLSAGWLKFGEKNELVEI
jgi:hypothetical protein